ncbi:MAG TPA: PerC family transcriptional regulator [Scandinavium sp.]
MQRAISKAEALEKRGLWRRAATQWLEVMSHNLDHARQEEVCKRRKYCLFQARSLKNRKN